MESLAQRLTGQLNEIVDQVDDLLDLSTILSLKERYAAALRAGVLVASMADFTWGEADDAQIVQQRKLLELWRPWWEQMELLFSGDTHQRKKEIHAAAARVLTWIERTKNGRDHSIPATIEEAKAVLRKHVAPLFEALDSLSKHPGGVTVVPDTNVVLRSQVLRAYGDVLGEHAFTVVLVPGVLQEIDQHKVHRYEPFRERARKFSQRIKGWRNQGDLSRGLRVEGDVFVRVVGKEPDFSKTLSWLDKDNADDRIIASILEIQRREPATKVVLLTGDAIMLAKADAASLPTADTPDPDP